MEQEQEQERIVKGIWIPIEIWKDSNLTWNEKILLLEIDSFTSQEKDCFFSDEYISKLLNISTTNANKTLSSLIKKGYVIKTKFDGRRRYVKSILSALSRTTTQPCQERQGLNSIINKDNNKEEIKEKENNKLFSKKNSKNQDELAQYDLTNVPNDFIDIIREWCQYKKERREKYKTQSSFMAMVKRLVKLSSNNVAKAKEIVEQSVANNYAGLFELKQRNNNDTPIGFILENDREDKHQNRKNW